MHESCGLSRRRLAATWDRATVGKVSPSLSVVSGTADGTTGKYGLDVAGVDMDQLWHDEEQ